MPPTCLAPSPVGAPLASWPEVVAQLERRGVAPVRTPSETYDQFENRLGTALMALYRDAREPAAFDALYRFTGPGVLLWIRSLLGREPASLDPAEVLQDTFVNVYRYPGAFRDEHGGSFRVWVRTIAGNVVRRAALARARATPQELETASELEDHARGPAQAMVDEDESQRLRRAWVLLLCFYARAWEELGQRDRRTLHLVEVEGLSYQEAGRILEVGRSSMKMIVFRSRRRIARRMREAMAQRMQGVVRPLSELVA
jgi:RNA polymerase sigma factor (sigma-70 family)